jgi:hypothetical protein
MGLDVTTAGATRIHKPRAGRPAGSRDHAREGKSDVSRAIATPELLDFVKALARDLARADANELRLSNAITGRKEAGCQPTTISLPNTDRNDRC